jgi:methyl-accepting chemotaxis protein
MSVLKNVKISRKLTGGVVVILILVTTGVGLLSYVQAYRTLQNESILNAPRMAVYGAAWIRSILDRNLTQVTELGEHPDVRSMDWTRQQPILERAVDRFGFFQIGVVRPDGTITLNDGSQTNVSDRAYFKAAMAGNTDISDVFIHRILKVPVMSIAVPMKTDAGAVLRSLRSSASWCCRFRY